MQKPWKIGMNKLIGSSCLFSKTNRKHNLTNINRVIWSEVRDCILSAIIITLTVLTHWGRVTHICVSKITIIGSDNGLSPDRRQAIIWTNAELLSIGPLRTYFNENLIKIQQFSLTKMHVKMSSAKWRPSCLGLNVLMISIWLGYQLGRRST